MAYYDGNNDQDDIERKMSLEEQIAHLRYLHRRDTTQLKAAVIAVQKEVETSNRTLTTKFSQEIELLQRMTLELHALCQRISDEHKKTTLSQKVDTNTTGVKANKVVNFDVESPSKEILPPSPNFADALGPIPSETEVKLAEIEKILEPIKDELNILAFHAGGGECDRPPCSGTSRFLNISNAIGDVEDLEQDIYSVFMVTNKLWSFPSLYTLMVASIQCFISVLIFIDLLHDELPVGVVDDNPINAPTKIPWTVSCAQFLAIIIAYITVNDMITSMKMFIMGYDPGIQIQNPGASYFKFVVANAIRFVQGMTTIFVCCLIVVQSTDVLEIFMNFAAVSFVSDLDNIAFELAQEGLCGKRLQEACDRVIETKIRVQRKHLGWLGNVFFVGLFLPFWSFFMTVRVMQQDGIFLVQDSCKNLNVHFGDEVYKLKPDVRFAFELEGNNKTFANSHRQVPFLEERPSDLAYQYFGGNYVAERAENGRLQEFNSRPIYWERGFKDPTSGKFYYCDAIKSWVFTIEALYDTPGAIEEKAREECEWGWLMQSPVTDAITLDEAPIRNWNIWVGNMKTSRPTFSIECSDCDRDSDCGLTHGTCNTDSGECICGESWQGRNCEMRKPYCPALAMIYEGQSAYDYAEWRPISLAVDFESKLPFLLYNRPVYTFMMTDDIALVLCYTGERWFSLFWTMEDLVILENHVGPIRYHGYWDNILDRAARYYSDATRGYSPTGFSTWYEIRESNSKGNFGIFGASFKVNGRFECIDVDCMDNPDICGDHGTCVKGTETFQMIDDGTPGDGDFATMSIPRKQCECRDGYGGYFCEYSTIGPYAKKMYDKYIADPVSFRENNTDLEYMMKYWENSPNYNNAMSNGITPEVMSEYYNETNNRNNNEDGEEL